MTLPKHIKDLQLKTLSDQWYVLKKATYQYLRRDGKWEEQQREAYDRGNGAAILLYNSDANNVILIEQFRLPTMLNGNPNGMMIEVCAGLLDEDDPFTCIKKEVLEETGYEVEEVSKVFEAYMSPGAVTEILHFFIAHYSPSMRKTIGGGKDDEQEDIRVIETSFPNAIAWIKEGKIKDAKTIMLLQYAQTMQLLNP